MVGFEQILKELESNISQTLDHCGIFYRIFARAKNTESIKKKMLVKAEKYKNEGTKMQDFFGLRVTLYFSDDVELLHNFLKCSSNYVEESINDELKDDKLFCPRVQNIVMRLPSYFETDFRAIKDDYIPEYSNLIDNTYEVQIRTVLSEGWHEVEHDLRYKCKEDWGNYTQYSRVLNGILATLETSEWSMLSLFDELAHTHYKKNDWDAMMRNKMRIRFNMQNGSGLNKDIKKYLTSNNETSRKLYKTYRKSVLKWILQSDFKMPLTYDTVLFIMNRLYAKDTYLIGLESPILNSKLNQLFNESTS